MLLRSAIKRVATCSPAHASTGMSPCFALFGQHMCTCDTDHKLAKKLKNLEDEHIIIKRDDKLKLIRGKIKENLHKSFERNEKLMKDLKQYLLQLPHLEACNE